MERFRTDESTERRLSNLKKSVNIEMKYSQDSTFDQAKAGNFLCQPTPIRYCVKIRLLLLSVHEDEGPGNEPAEKPKQQNEFPLVASLD